MRFVISTILILALAFATEYFMHAWWVLAVVAFVISVIMKLEPGRGFLSGFVAIAIMCACVAFRADGLNDHILATRMAKLFTVPNYHVFLVVVVFIGGLVGGLAAWAGAMAGKYGKPATQNDL